MAALAKIIEKLEMRERGKGVRDFEWQSTNELFWGISSLIRIWGARLIRRKGIISPGHSPAPPVAATM